MKDQRTRWRCLECGFYCYNLARCVKHPEARRIRWSRAMEFAYETAIRVSAILPDLDEWARNFDPTYYPGFNHGQALEAVRLARAWKDVRLSTPTFEPTSPIGLFGRRPNRSRE